MNKGDIPAISIRQPWAELVVSGRKRMEIRTWIDPYRGPLWVHASRTVDEPANAFFALGPPFTGGYIGMVDLIDIVPLDEALWDTWRDLHCVPGLIPHGGYALVFANPRRLTRPIPAPGQLKIFKTNPKLQVELLSALGSLQEGR